MGEVASTDEFGAPTRKVECASRLPQPFCFSIHAASRTGPKYRRKSNSSAVMELGLLKPYMAWFLDHNSIMAL